MRLTAWGGVDEIGGNKFLLEGGGVRVFLDFGMSYHREGDYFEPPFLQPGCRDDLLKTGVIPGLPGLYRGAGLSASYDPALGPVGVEGTEEQCAFDALLLSHAHVDHYGYAGLLHASIPIYASPLTRRLIELREVVSDGFASRLSLSDVRCWQPSVPLRIGDMEAGVCPVDHSAPGAAAWILEADGVRVGYTGDLRLHGPPEGREQTLAFLQLLASRPVDYLLCEGTRFHPRADETEKEVEHHGLPSEDDVAGRAREILSAEPGLVIYDGSPADLGRLKQVCRAAMDAGRKIAVDAKLAFLLLYVNSQEPLLEGCEDIADRMHILLGRRKLSANSRTQTSIGRDGVFLETFDEGRGDHEKLLLAAQKQQRAAQPGSRSKPDPELQTAIAVADERFIWGPRRRELLQNPGDWLVYTSNGPLFCLHSMTSPGSLGGTYVYGKAEPFNEEMEFTFARLRNWVNLAGLKMEYAHTSGHMREEDLRLFLRESGARRVIPIHTEASASFAELHPDVLQIGPGEGVTIGTMSAHGTSA